MTPEQAGKELAFQQEFQALCKKHSLYLDTCGCCCGITDDPEKDGWGMFFWGEEGYQKVIDGQDDP